MKSGFVAILGRPNAGKSTLLNALLKEKIAITSSKAETTRNAIVGILNKADLQIVFVDTPGIHSAKTILGSYMNKEAFAQAEGVDVIYYLCDATNGLHEEDFAILNKVKNVAPIFLVLNKIDLIAKGELIGRVIYAGKHFNFAEIIPLSALKEDNLEELLATTIKHLHDEVLYYEQNTSTALSKEFRIAEIIREKILLCYDDEVPHLVAVNVEEFKETEKRIKIGAVITCAKDSHKGILIGKGGKRLAKLNAFVVQDLAKWLGKKIQLSLFIKVEEDWLNKSKKLFELGYHYEK